MGYHSDVKELCNLADIFGFPSHRDGIGMAALEAMACVMSVVTSNVHEINDYGIDGVTGYKCLPDDVSGFVNAVKKLIDNPDNFRCFGVYNRKRVKDYRDDKVQNRIMGIYRD